MVALLASASMVVFAQSQPSTDIESLEKTLKSASDLSGDFATVRKRMATIFKLRKGVKPEVADTLVCASASGLVAIGDAEAYAKVRNFLQNQTSFESEISTDCTRCDGTGRGSVKCLKCGGSGKCPNSGCKNGMTEQFQLSGPPLTRKCSFCSGSGLCRHCKGKGLFDVACPICKGKGRHIDKGKARDYFKTCIANAQNMIAAETPVPAVAEKQNPFGEPKDDNVPEVVAENPRQPEANPTPVAEETVEDKTIVPPPEEATKEQEVMTENQEQPEADQTPVAEQPVEDKPTVPPLEEATTEQEVVAENQEQPEADQTPVAEQPEKDLDALLAQKKALQLSESEQKEAPQTSASAQKKAPQPSEYQYSANMGILSKHLYDPEEVKNRWDNSRLTSIKRTELARQFCERGLSQNNDQRARLLYHAVPDGVYFIVEKIHIGSFVDGTTPFVVTLSIFGEDRSQCWEHYNSISDPVHNTPWGCQSREWRKSFEEYLFPAMSFLRQEDYKMILDDNASAFEAARNLNIGTIVESKGWVAALEVSDRKGNPKADGPYYWLFPSAEVAFAFANGDAQRNQVDCPKFKAVQPRNEADKLLARIENWSRSRGLVGMKQLLADVKASLNRIPLGERFYKELGYIIEADDFPALHKAVEQGDRRSFETELAAAIARLDQIESRPAKAKVSENAATIEAMAWEHEHGTFGSSNVLRFETIWSLTSSASPLYKDFIHTFCIAFPDDVAFVVEDVDGEDWFNRVTLRALVYGETPEGQQKPWTGDKRQDKLFWKYMAQRFGSKTEYHLIVPCSRHEVVDWQPGMVLKSDGWISESLVENSVSTLKNGRKVANREVYFGGVTTHALYRSVEEKSEILKTARSSD